MVSRTALAHSSLRSVAESLAPGSGAGGAGSTGEAAPDGSEDASSTTEAVPAWLGAREATGGVGGG
eukprot:6372804-Alexandrium_andersonii.AAC.1